MYHRSRPEQLGRATNSVSIYDSTEGVWYRGAPMLQCRAYFVLLVKGDVMYAVGGEDEHSK